MDTYAWRLTKYGRGELEVGLVAVSGRYVAQVRLRAESGVSMLGHLDTTTQLETSPEKALRMASYLTEELVGIGYEAAEDPVLLDFDLQAEGDRNEEGLSVALWGTFQQAVDKANRARR